MIDADRPADGTMLKTALEILEASGDWIGGEEFAHRGRSSRRCAARIACPSTAGRAWLAGTNCA
jgi:hypothetical protein